MKKIFIFVFLLLSVFTSCRIPLPTPTFKYEIEIYNDCAWAIDTLISYPDYNITPTKLHLGKDSIKANIYSPASFHVLLKGAYDFDYKIFNFPYGIRNSEIWHIEWSSYEGKYIIKRQRKD